MIYRYSLDKSSKKFRCPHCHKITFVRYFDNVEQHYLEESHGRCDRESKCRYHSMPNQQTLVPQVSNYTPPVPSYHKNQEVVNYGRNFKNNNFIQYLKKHFTENEIQNVILIYLVGTTRHWNGAVVFWQMDHHSKVHGGKVMLYDSNTGKRVKKPYPHINWIHKINKESDFVLQQCLFGLHLIKEYDTDTVAIVESEKTAIIMSILIPEHLWMATGSKANLKERLLLPLKHHNLILFPDKTEYKAWTEKALHLAAKGFKISCSRLLESCDLEQGDDLVDLFLKVKNEPHLNGPLLSPTEKNLKRLAEINPMVWNLVEEFGLV
ncbi:hypothetical protein KCTC52924_03597 [Arenibacter antarcticus]|uniref:DUF6371 domain-containing protein n=1 Tax=Arenibacter antarcticus TaxID=2040469 RepID=A0ABW5VF36_9FLAO|nr:DUF6371 domain-containing protein [Arenibacter sp. H213]